MGKILRSSYQTPIIILLLIIFQQSDYSPAQKSPELPLKLI